MKHITRIELMCVGAMIATFFIPFILILTIDPIVAWGITFCVTLVTGMIIATAIAQMMIWVYPDYIIERFANPEKIDMIEYSLVRMRSSKKKGD